MYICIYTGPHLTDSYTHPLELLRELIRVLNGSAPPLQGLVTCPNSSVFLTVLHPPLHAFPPSLAPPPRSFPSTTPLCFFLPSRLQCVDVAPREWVQGFEVRVRS